MRERIERAENLIATRKAEALAVAIYAVTRQGSWAKDYGLASQIQRAAVSVASNICEGHALGSRAQFAASLAVSRGSISEVACQLRIAHAIGYLDNEQFEILAEQTEEVARLVGGLRRAVVRQRDGQ